MPSSFTRMTVYIVNKVYDDIITLSYLLHSGVLYKISKDQVSRPVTVLKTLDMIEAFWIKAELEVYQCMSIYKPNGKVLGMTMFCCWTPHLRWPITLQYVCIEHCW